MAPRERKRVPSAFEAFSVSETSSTTALTVTLWFMVSWRRDSPSTNQEPPEQNRFGRTKTEEVVVLLDIFRKS